MSLHVMPHQPFASVLKCILQGFHRALRCVLEVFIIRRNLQSFNFKMGLVLTPLFIALLLPGCAIVNPNITLSRPDSAVKDHTLSEGIRYAEDAIEKYDNYISSNNWFSGTIGVLMIGASAAALALGITDGGTTAIAALGVSGASLFGIGTFLTDSSRNAIYNEGKEKVICAIATVQPLLLSTENIEKFREALETLYPKIANVQSDIQLVRNAKIKLGGGSPDQGAQDSIDSANATIKLAVAAYEAGAKLDLQLFRAGNAVITAVDGINAEVNKRLDGTVASLEAANNIIGGLATASTRLISLPKDAQSQAEIDQSPASALNGMSPVDALSKALMALAKSNGILSDAVAKVTTIVAGVESSLGNLGQCKLNLQELTLTVEPKSIEFTKGTAETRRLIILTGKKPFAAQFLEQSDAKHLFIDQPVPFGSTVDVKYDGDQAVGRQYTVHIVDGAERNVFVNVVVK